MTPKQKKLVNLIAEQAETGCWLWQGQISNSGYGRLMELQPDATTKMVSAHCASYRAFIGSLPEGVLVKQTCGERLCINPAHLELFHTG